MKQNKAKQEIDVRSIWLALISGDSECIEQRAVLRESTYSGNTCNMRVLMVTHT